jgi:hypothetical protein
MNFKGDKPMVGIKNWRVLALFLSALVLPLADAGNGKQEWKVPPAAKTPKGTLVADEKGNLKFDDCDRKAYPDCIPRTVVAVAKGMTVELDGKVSNVDSLQEKLKESKSLPVTIHWDRYDAQTHTLYVSKIVHTPPK